MSAVGLSLLSGCHDSSSGATDATAGAAVQSSTLASTATPSAKSATLSWEAPTTNTDGSALTDLAGYRIYYGSSASDLSETVQITSVGLQTYVIDNLPPGTWYFAILAVTTSGAESALSNVVSKTIG